MLQDVLDSLARPASYRRFSAERPARCAAYVAFLSLVFVGALGAAVKLRLAPLFSETFSWLESSMPALSFSSGTVTSSVPGPTRLEHPRVKEIALLVDTSRREPVGAEEMAAAKVFAYVTGSAVYLRRGGEVQAVDLSQAGADRPVTVDAATYRDMSRAFNWVFYPALLGAFFLGFAASIGVCGLLYGLGALLAASAFGGSLRYGAAFRVAVHAQTAGSLLYALDMALPRSIPYFRLASIALSAAYVVLGARAAAAGAEPAA